MPKYYKREITDLNNTGQKQYRYELHSLGALTTAEVARRVNRRMHLVSEGDCMAIASEMVAVMAEILAGGNTVTIDGLGSFSLSLALADYDDDTPEQRRGGEPNARRIHVSDVHFKPQKRFIRRVDSICRDSLVRVPGGTSVLRRSEYTREERIQRALQLIREQGMMTLAEYVTLNGLSRTSACRELKALCADPSVPIRERGRAPHRVYVEEK